METVRDSRTSVRFKRFSSPLRFLYFFFFFFYTIFFFNERASPLYTLSKLLLERKRERKQKGKRLEQRMFRTGKDVQQRSLAANFSPCDLCDSRNWRHLVVSVLLFDSLLPSPRAFARKTLKTFSRTIRKARIRIKNFKARKNAPAKRIKSHVDSSPPPNLHTRRRSARKNEREREEERNFPREKCRLFGLLSRRGSRGGRGRETRSIEDRNPRVTRFLGKNNGALLRNAGEARNP